MPDEPTSAEAKKERRARPAISARDQLHLNRVVSSLLFSRGMETNTSFGDRALRVAAGALLLAIVFFGPTTPWGIVGIVPLVTGLTGSCPFYRAFGVSTSQRPSTH
ncbi:MAG: YgaP family membrane protein [Polyangiales bacterium]